MKVFAIFVAVLVASAAADSAEFTFANQILQSVEQMVVAQINVATTAISTAVNNDLVMFQNFGNSFISLVKATGNAPLLVQANALVNTISAQIAANFNPATVASSILAPYQAILANWYAQVSKQIATLNTANPPVNLACLQSVQSSINGSATNLTKIASNDVTQQLNVINARFTTLNNQMKTNLASLQQQITSTCGSNLLCASLIVGSNIPSINTMALASIQTIVAGLASDVVTAATNAATLQGIFNSYSSNILQQLAVCAASA